jgi:hypothetical protein
VRRTWTTYRIIFNKGRELRIRHNPVKDAINLFGKLPQNF